MWFGARSRDEMERNVQTLSLMVCLLSAAVRFGACPIPRPILGHRNVHRANFCKKKSKGKCCKWLAYRADVHRRAAPR
jgi:hypothetical protein